MLSPSYAFKGFYINYNCMMETPYYSIMERGFPALLNPAFSDNLLAA